MGGWDHSTARSTNWFLCSRSAMLLISTRSSLARPDAIAQMCGTMQASTRSDAIGMKTYRLIRPQSRWLWFPTRSRIARVRATSCSTRSRDRGLRSWRRDDAAVSPAPSNLILSAWTSRCAAGRNSLGARLSMRRAVRHLPNWRMNARPCWQRSDRHDQKTFRARAGEHVRERCRLPASTDRDAIQAWPVRQPKGTGEGHSEFPDDVQQDLE